jgi:hypothetical protein
MLVVFLHQLLLSTALIKLLSFLDPFVSFHSGWHLGTHRQLLSMLGDLLLSFEILAIDHFVVEIDVDMPRDDLCFKNKSFSFPVIFAPWLLSGPVVEGKRLLIL